MIENGRAVLRSHIVALSIQSCGVVDRKEDLQNFAKRQYLRVKRDLHDFRVSGITITHILISRPRRMSPHIARLHAFHALESVVHRLQTPEAAARKGRDLLAGWVSILFHCDLLLSFPSVAGMQVNLEAAGQDVSYITRIKTAIVPTTRTPRRSTRHWEW